MKENKITEHHTETQKHIENVKKHIKSFTNKLANRVIEYDKAKSESFEIDEQC